MDSAVVLQLEPRFVAAAEKNRSEAVAPGVEECNYVGTDAGDGDTSDVGEMIATDHHYHHLAGCFPWYRHSNQNKNRRKSQNSPSLATFQPNSTTTFLSQNQTTNEEKETTKSTKINQLNVPFSSSESSARQETKLIQFFLPQDVEEWDN